LTKFRDLFASEELYLRRLDKFKESDPREGLPSDAYARHVRGLQTLDVHDEVQLIHDQAFARQNSEGYFINCWHLFERETLEMWNSYGNCACILSRAELLRAAIDSFLDPMFFGIVRYSESGKTGYNLIDFAYPKRFQFHGDRELRMLLQCYDPLAGMNRHIAPDGTAHREPLDDINPLHSWVPDSKRRRIDLKELVTEIRLAPSISQEVADEIRLWVHNKNFTCPVRPSDLRGNLTPSSDEFKKYGA
jgi:hypothetical protein